MLFSQPPPQHSPFAVKLGTLGPLKPFSDAVVMSKWACDPGFTLSEPPTTTTLGVSKGPPPTRSQSQ